MSRQYQKNKNKRPSKRNKPDSRVHAVAVSSGTKYDIMSDGTRVKQELFENTAEIEQMAVMENPVVQNDGVCIVSENEESKGQQFTGVTVAYPGQEENDRKRKGTLSDDETKRMRSDPHSFQIGEKVAHIHHKALGIGRILRKIPFPDCEYRWAVKWNAHSASKMHAADFLLKRLDAESLEEDHIEPVKHPDPNRAFREHKSRKQFFGGVAGAAFCSECKVVLSGGGYGEPGSPERWCMHCFKERREQGTAEHRSRAITRIHKKPATAKQLRTIAELGIAKGVTSAANMATLTFPAAANIIDAWSEMPDNPYGHESEISTSLIQKRVITSFEKRAGIILTPEQVLDSYSAEQASHYIEEMQQELDEAR